MSLNYQRKRVKDVIENRDCERSRFPDIGNYAGSGEENRQKPENKTLRMSPN